MRKRSSPPNPLLYLVPRRIAVARFLVVLCAAMLLVPAAARAQDEDAFGAVPAIDPANVVSVRTAWSKDAAAPGEELILAVVAEIEPGFHINSDPGQQLPQGDFEPYPTAIRVTAASEELTIESVRFPAAHPVAAEYVEDKVMVFEGRTIFYLPMRVTADALKAPVGVTIEFEYQACDDKNCFFPAVETIGASLPAAAGAAPLPANEELFAAYAATPAGAAASEAVGFDLFGLSFSVDASSKAGLALLLLVAMIGGALLNFTPCVLPVIPIKIIGLSSAAESRGRCFALGATMSLGVVAFWLGLGLLIALVAGFTATNQLFQYPAFTITVGIVIAFMAVAMTGMFVFRLPQFVYAFNPGQETYAGSFGFGIMTAILSTPCTAPFMGAAAAWAATQHSATTLATFGAIGLGMALPYLVLSASPGLVKKMPKTGPASELIKQVMGLLMLAAAAYFVGVGLSALLSGPPDPPSLLYWWGVMAFVAAGGVWLALKTFGITARTGRRVLFGGLGVLVAAAAVLGAVRLSDRGPIDWVYYTPERFQEALAAGDVVVMDFTAEWCLNCKSLEHGVLHTDRVAGALKEPGVTPIKVDITGNNPDGKAMLKKAGRLTIPLLIVYAPDGREVLKSDFYTVEQVLAALDEARGAGARVASKP